jgi:hypothetical protein
MCSPFGIRDFPILNSVPVTPSLNALIYEEVPLDIQWGPKANEPTFIHDGPYANLGYLEYMGAGASTTSLRFNGNSFSLISVQLCSPQHATLLPRDKQRDCSGELVMGFKAQSTISESYLFLCVPILTRPTTTPSIYLEALRQGRLDGKPTSLLSILPPSDQHFISYSTCLQRRESAATSTNQTRVFVFTEGLAYPAANFLEIARKITMSSVTNPIYLPAIQLPDGLVDKSQAMLFSLTTETDYKSLLRYSQYYPQGTPDSSQYRTDTLNSYKCVPLDPSQNVKDGKIIVDTENGELLSQVLEDKDDSGKAKRTKITPAIVEKIMAVCIAVLLVAFVFLIVAYIITSMTTPNADSFFGIIKQNAGSVAPVVFFSSLVGVICFMIGIFLSNLV